MMAALFKFDFKAKYFNSEKLSETWIYFLKILTPFDLSFVFLLCGRSCLLNGKAACSRKRPEYPMDMRMNLLIKEILNISGGKCTAIETNII